MLYVSYPRSAIMIVNWLAGKLFTISTNAVDSFSSYGSWISASTYLLFKRSYNALRCNWLNPKEPSFPAKCVLLFFESRSKQEIYSRNEIHLSISGKIMPWIFYKFFWLMFHVFDDRRKLIANIICVEIHWLNLLKCIHSRKLCGGFFIL